MSEVILHETAKLMRTEITESDESIPHERVEFESFRIVLNGFGRVAVRLPQLSLKTVYRCCVREMLPPGLCMFACTCPKSVVEPKVTDGLLTPGITVHPLPLALLEGGCTLNVLSEVQTCLGEDVRTPEVCSS